MCSTENCVEYNGGNVHDVTRFALNLFERTTKLGPHAYLPSIPLPPPLFHELVLLRVWVEGCTTAVPDHISPIATEDFLRISRPSRSGTEKALYNKIDTRSKSPDWKEARRSARLPPRGHYLIAETRGLFVRSRITGLTPIDFELPSTVDPLGSLSGFRKASIARAPRMDNRGTLNGLLEY
ncbi:hypothetical protein N7494_000761 [Penicillium frequentans]|uniref:Uncharacterized protein n=1 Tax=Penicillium frequentans TaxID=3151616 RepID=A0AAD6GK43_9EURO|nr:hypothetical protein N7494_000761 [Penicillium glabrum]